MYERLIEKELGVICIWRIRIREFLRDFSTLQHAAFFHTLAYISGKLIEC